jgi:hypothetical protein
MRSIIQLEVEGTRLVGTCHRSDSEQRMGLEETGQRGEIGILYSNVGWLPRSSRGDLAAHLADYTARLGFPSFRFDMPGLGDSDGALPSEVLPFFQLIQEGAHVKFISALKAELVRRYGLAGMIYWGHCGSATTAVYDAVTDEADDLLGLILLDPAFVWYRAPGGISRGLLTGRSGLRIWLAGKPGAEIVIRAWANVKSLYSRMRRTTVPASSNQRLLDCYQRLLARELPMLVITAPPPVRKAGYFEYVRFIQRGRPLTSLLLVEVEGTDHAFLAGGGKPIVFEQIRKWLLKNFPSKVNSNQPRHAAEAGQAAIPSHP